METTELQKIVFEYDEVKVIQNEDYSLSIYKYDRHCGRSFSSFNEAIMYAMGAVHKLNDSQARVLADIVDTYLISKYNK